MAKKTKARSLPIPSDWPKIEGVKRRDAYWIKHNMSKKKPKRSKRTGRFIKG